MGLHYGSAGHAVPLRRGRPGRGQALHHGRQVRFLWLVLDLEGSPHLWQLQRGLPALRPGEDHRRQDQRGQNGAEQDAEGGHQDGGAGERIACERVQGVDTCKRFQDTAGQVERVARVARERVQGVRGRARRRGPGCPERVGAAPAGGHGARGGAVGQAERSARLPRARAPGRGAGGRPREEQQRADGGVGQHRGSRPRVRAHRDASAGEPRQREQQQGEQQQGEQRQVAGDGRLRVPDYAVAGRRRAHQGRLLRRSHA
mmetsp:Transcript_63288/g.195965  ORF Transcript_63288/g.195965 Transcript_63288/m.195965 type:complete len:259 (-) Transcript_63288:53-829(-)